MQATASVDGPTSPGLWPYTVTAAPNGTRLARCSASETLGYTSLLPTGPRSALVVYSLSTKGCKSCAYSMRFSVEL